MQYLKITAVTGKGHPIVTVTVNAEETMDAVLDIISDKLTTSPLNNVYPLLDSWILGGRTIKIEREE